MVEPTTGGAGQDYRALREVARAVDLSAWTLLRLRGADTRSFLQGLATQDFETAHPSAAPQALFLNEKGRPVALAWVHLDGAGTEAWVIADEGVRSTLRAHFERFRIMEDVEFEGPAAPAQLVGFAGPARPTLVREAAASLPGSTVLDSDPLSFLILPTDPIVPASPGAASPIHRPAIVERSAYEAWRLSAGIPRNGVDIDLDRIATELSLPNAISLTKGCYVGQEVVARTSNRGKVRRHRVGFRFDWKGEPIAPRTEIRAAGVPAGYVTSSAPEPGTKQALGMGYLAADADPNSNEIIAVDGTTTTHLRIAPWPL